jgi:hypothetical protein
MSSNEPTSTRFIVASYAIRYSRDSVIVEASGFVLRRNWIPLIASALLVLAGLLVTQLAGASSLFGYLMVWFGGTFGPIMFVRNAFPRPVPTTIRANASAVVVDGHEEVAAEDILEARVLRRAGDAIVELVLRGRKRLSLRMAAADAKALVDLLGARRSRFRLMMPFSTRFFAVLALQMFVALAVFGSNVGAVLATLPSAVILALLFGWLVGFLRGRLVVGAEGFTTRWLFRERFVAFRDVTAVGGKGRFVNRSLLDTEVQLTSGRRLRLRTVEAPNTEEERGAEGRAMLAHVQESFNRSRRLLEGSVDVPSLVERGSRSAREWLSGLDALVRGGGSRYRVAAVSAEMLTDLTNDPSATVESRVGAAAALVRMDDDALRTRVRVAAEGCAESELRDTLLALSDARDDVTTEAALASLRR